jgi:hypothetical protein
MDSASGLVLAKVLGREEEGVAFTLVIPLQVIMIHEIRQSAPQRGLADQNQFR